MSTETRPKYTVFREATNDSDGYLIQDDDLQACIDYAAEAWGGAYAPVLWAPGWPSKYDHLAAKSDEELRAESISAGRTIEKVDGRYLARGVPVEGKPAKSIEFTTALHPITKKVVPVAISYGPGYEAVHFTVDLGRPVRTSIAEPKREPLTWNKPVKVDRFPGFTSTYDGPVIANEGEGLGVQRISPIDRDPKNGSAFLKEMKG